MLLPLWYFQLFEGAAVKTFYSFVIPCKCTANAHYHYTLVPCICCGMLYLHPCECFYHLDPGSEG